MTNLRIGFSRKSLFLQIWITFLLSGKSQSAPLVDTGNAITKAVAAATNTNTGLNISVSLHPPVIVPALQATSEETAETPSSASTEVPRQHLAPEVFNSGFALINGTPVFMNPSSSGEQVMMKVSEATEAAPPSVSEKLNRPPLTSQEAKEKDSASIAHSVMKAMEHLNNISQEEALNRRNSTTTIDVIKNSANASLPNGNVNTSSVSIIVVPLIQNAFDLPDDRNPSAAQSAANHPMVFSQQNGNHTTLHVVVKREDSAVGEQKTDGSFTTSADFLGGDLIAPNPLDLSKKTSNLTKVPLGKGISASINGSVWPLENSHGPLTDEDFTTASSVPVQLTTPEVVIRKPNHDSISSIPNQGGQKPELLTASSTSGVLFKSELHPGLLSGAILLPSMLVPVNTPLVQSVEVVSELRSSDTPTGPIFFEVPPVNPKEVVPRASELPQQNTQPIHEPPQQDGLSMSAGSSILSVQVSTLPSAPRVVLDISEPISALKPLPLGTFAFLPIQEKTNVTVAGLLSAMNV